jgi:hypothetical protein
MAYTYLGGTRHCLRSGHVPASREMTSGPLLWQWPRARHVIPARMPVPRRQMTAAAGSSPLAELETCA